MQVFSCISMAQVLALLCPVIITGCDGARAAFIEPISGGGQSELWGIFAEANQAAGPDRLGEISDAMHQVRYSMSDRYTPFLLAGDIEQGAQPVGLQLPRVAPSVADVTVDVRRTGTNWQSFRVYDRGECSLLLDWQTVADAIVGGLMEQIKGSDRVHDPAFVTGRLTPILRSEFPSSQVTPPIDADQLQISWRWTAGNIGTDRVLGCDNTDMTIRTTIEFVPTDLAWYLTDSAFFVWVAAACQDPEVSFVDVAEAMATGEYSTIANRCGEMGTAPATLDGIGEWELDAVGDARFLSDLSGDPEAEGVVVGLRSVGGNPLGAHDTLVRVLSFSIPMFTHDKCTNRRRRLTLAGFESTIRQGLVLGLNQGLLDQAVLDPWLVGQPQIRCQQDSDCNAEIEGPVFEAPDGSWGGARHVCRTRDKESLRELVEDSDATDAQKETLLTIIDAALRDGEFCFAQLEPDHLNVRPDGLEGVVAFSRADDIQSHMLPEEGGLASRALCAPERAGRGPEVGVEPRFVETSTPLFVRGL